MFCFRIEKEIFPGDRAIFRHGDHYITYTGIDIDAKKFLLYELFDNSWNSVEKRMIGENLRAHAPTVVEVRKRLFVVFLGKSPFKDQSECVWFYEHGTDNVKPVFVPHGMRVTEKNWAPFDYRGSLAFVYCFDPLVVFTCDTDTGKCSVIKGQFPCNTSGLAIKGGTSLWDAGEFFKGFVQSKHEGLRMTHLVKITKKLDMCSVSEPVTFGRDEEDTQVPLSAWTEGDKIYVTATVGKTCVVAEFQEKTWSEKVRDMLSSRKFSQSSPPR
jgi:hypothetical protein